MDSNWILMKDRLPTTPTIGSWLTKNLSSGSAVGVDPNIISCQLWNQLATALDENGLF